MEKVCKFTLKLKIGITLSDVNPTLAQTTVEAAVNAGVFTSVMIMPCCFIRGEFIPIRYGNI